MDTIHLSPLGHTWLFDLDGTLVKHNGYKLDGHDTLLAGVKELLSGIPADDAVIILTSRTEQYRQATLDFLNDSGIRFDHILFGLPFGERILVNDSKPSGLQMAIAVNTERDQLKVPKFKVDDAL